MSFLRVGRLAAMVLFTLLCLSCGQVYRPVVIPLTTTPPSPSSYHTVFGISANVPNYPGGAMQIDVAGDSVAAETPSSDKSAPNLGNNPTYAAILPNLSRVFVASAGSITPGGVDVVSSFSPQFQSSISGGLGAVNSINLPTGSQPVFVSTTQSTALYVANYNTNSVSAINTTTNAISNSAAVGANPVALAETPNGLKVYVANQGGNSVSSLNTVDLSANTVTGFTGTTPVWVVARGDSQKVYVLTQGDGQLVTIDTATDSVTSSLPVGAGANFIFYDPPRNRLYVTNPATGILNIFSDTGGSNDTPTLLTPQGIAIPGLNAATTPSCQGCSASVPVSVTALSDGSRFYVASYQTAASCPDVLVTGACVIPSLAVFDANSLALKTTMTLLTNPPFSVSGTGQYQYAVPAVTACVPPPLYSPSATRFRVFTTASADSSRVYVSMCDAGAIAVINTTNNNGNNPSGSGSPADTLITDLPTAFSAGTIQSNGEPPNQNPIFLLTGQ
jgi:YVTN family beta-propeller protein